MVVDYHQTNSYLWLLSLHQSRRRIDIFLHPVDKYELLMMCMIYPVDHMHLRLDRNPLHSLLLGLEIFVPSLVHH